MALSHHHLKARWWQLLGRGGQLTQWPDVVQSVGAFYGLLKKKLFYTYQIFKISKVEAY